jgi:4-amino-4-deoxy-L-arabinose transferase-like glycosyltransferase
MTTQLIVQNTLSTPVAKADSQQHLRVQSARRSTRPLLLILLVGVVLRAGLWYCWSDWSPLINSDAQDYQRLAVRLVTTGKYADERGIPISLRPPLYPVVLAAIYSCFGLKNNDAVRVAQAGFGLLAVVLVYQIGIIAYSRQVALWAAGIFSCYPSLLVYANLLLSETLFTLFVVAFTWLVLEAIKRQRISLVIAAGVVMGLAALTRSIMLLFLPFLATFLLVCWQGGLSRRFMVAAVATLAFLVTIAPWAVRNTRIQKTFTLIDVMGGRNAMMGNYEYTPLERSWATFADVQGEQAWDRVLYSKHRFETPITQGRLDKLALRYAIEFILAHPWLTVKRDLVKFFNFWQLEREVMAAARSGYFVNMPAGWQLPLGIVICASYAIVLIAAVFGSCCARPLDSHLHWFLLISILFPCAVHTLIFAHSRYHLPIVPLLIVYAAAAIVYRREIWLHRRKWQFKLAVIISVIIAFGWLRELIFVDMQAVQHFFV